MEILPIIFVLNIYLCTIFLVGLIFVYILFRPCNVCFFSMTDSFISCFSFVQVVQFISLISFMQVVQVSFHNFIDFIVDSLGQFALFIFKLLLFFFGFNASMLFLVNNLIHAHLTQMQYTFSFLNLTESLLDGNLVLQLICHLIVVNGQPPRNYHQPLYHLI